MVEETIKKDLPTYDESSISVLEGLEAVRVRPGMYIGSTGKNGLHHCVYEIVDNSIDEANNGSCDTINVIINNNGSITIIDNGRGIPCGIHPKKGISTLEVALSTLHAGGKFGQGGYKTSGGLHGVGSSVVNALSKEFTATINRDNKIYQQTYSKGKKTSEVEIIGKSTNTGTMIQFTPDDTIFNATIFDYNTISKRLRELAFLNKKITITLEDNREGKTQTQSFHYDGGLEEFIKYITGNKPTIQDNIICIEKEVEECQIEVAFQYVENYSELLNSFVNNINTTEGGYHVTGFYSGLTKSLNDFAKNNKYLKEKDEKFQRDDVKEGIISIISVKMPDPEFEGQTKTKLGNTYIQKVVSDAVNEYMETFCIENKIIMEEIINKIILSQQSRLSAKKAKEMTRKKSGLTKSRVLKLTDCTSSIPEECEIHLVEGDSAGGNAKQARNRKTQAILPQRGKSKNTEKTPNNGVLSEDLENIENSLGCGTGKNYKEEDLKFHKVICLADGDSDGMGHITTLWLTYFYREMKQLILNGHLYVAIPPLFKNVLKIEKGIEIIEYTYTESEQLDFLQSNEPLRIQRYKGIGEMSSEQLGETVMDKETRHLIQITIDDEKEADETITLLMGDKVPPRYDFIMKNGKFKNR